jgi:hypothetical protein
MQMIDMLSNELLRPTRPATFHDLKGHVQQALHVAQFRVHELDIFVEQLVCHAWAQLVKMALWSKRRSGLVELLQQALRNKLGEKASEHQGKEGCAVWLVVEQQLMCLRTWEGCRYKAGKR